MFSPKLQTTRDNLNMELTSFDGINHGFQVGNNRGSITANFYPSLGNVIPGRVGHPVEPVTLSKIASSY